MEGVFPSRAVAKGPRVRKHEEMISVLGYLVRAIYDALLHRVILFGGQENNGYFNDAWELIP